MLNPTTRRLVGGLALALGLIGLAVPSASAVDLGDLFVTPTTGTANDFITMDTHAPCPDGTVNVKVFVTGPGINDNTANNLNGVTSLAATTPNSSNGFSIQAAQTLKDIFTAYAITAPSGDYTLNLRCQNGNGGTIYGDFLGTIHLTPTANAFEGNYSLVSNATATTTAISTGTPDPIKYLTATSLTATVTPANAVGNIQFKRGTTAIGAPIAVSGGTATLDSTVLPAGTQSLTAVFIPTDANAFGPSTSPAKSYVVAGPATISGTVKVGYTVTCSSVATATATKAISWIVSGATSSITTSSVKVPSSWASKSLKCAVKTTKNAAFVTQTSAAKTVAKGTFKVTTAPRVTGTATVGHYLTCSHGTWSPTPTSYKYQWYRGTTALTGKTASTYKTTSSDRGKYVTCKVPAIKTGYTSGVAKAPARKIS